MRSKMRKIERPMEIRCYPPRFIGWWGSLKGRCIGLVWCSDTIFSNIYWVREVMIGLIWPPIQVIGAFFET